MRNHWNGLGVWLERLIMVAVVLVAANSAFRAFRPLVPDYSPKLRSFLQLQKYAAVLSRESDPSRREISLRMECMEANLRDLDAKIPTSARVFLLDMLGRENFARIGYYRYSTYYLFPRQVAISLGELPVLQLDRVTGRKPASTEELSKAGCDFAVKIDPDRIAVLPLGASSLQPPETRPKPIPRGDWLVALLLPLAVALTGSRVVRWLFKDLQGVLSAGELLASGLAVGAFFLTQLTLGFRLAGARLERILTVAIMAWAAGEVVLLARRWRVRRPQFKVRDCWWLLLVPAALILWSQFRLAGLLGIVELDAVEDWAFKAKILHQFAGKEMWTWFHNPSLAYAHMDYPLLVPLLHALTYGALGHLNDFVTKFWNQWMLLLLAWSILGVGQFPEKRPWLFGSLTAAIVLLPMSREYSFMEGATIPMLFYTVLSSVQLAVGVMEQQAGRLRLGLFLLMALAMVKFEGMLLLGLWGVLLLFERRSRAVLWPVGCWGWAVWLGLAAWLPYVVFRLHGPVPHPESGWVRQLLTNGSAIFQILPMTWVALVSRRFLDNGFAAWTSPDNQHAVWQGHWLGWQSLVDPMTQGVGWVCLLLLGVAWCQGGQLRWMRFRLFLVFLVFATMISLVWSAVRSSPINFDVALGVSDETVGGRYLYPLLMAWFVVGVILLPRESQRKVADF